MKSNARPRSLITSNWSADVDDIHGGLVGFVQHLQLLSLLYDEIAIPDEFLALSTPLANWFTTIEGQRIWAELLDMGSLVILRHPEAAYANDDLRHRSSTTPIFARAKQISLAGTKNEAPFEPTATQEAFHLFTDSLLRSRPGSIREVASTPRAKKVAIMPVFSQTIGSILESSSYRDWWRVHFPSLDDEILARFHLYVKEPERILSERRARKLDTTSIVLDRALVFNRSLAYQATDLFDQRVKSDLRRVVQSVFASVFCWREESLGQYGGKVCPIPNLRSVADPQFDECLVEVGVETTVSLSIPSLLPGFSRVVREVRELPEGESLRKAVSEIDSSPSFSIQKECWGYVAKEMAARFSGGGKFPISIHEVGHKAKHTSQVGLLVHAVQDLATGTFGLQTLLHTAQSAAKEFAGGLAIDCFRQLGASQRLAYEIERAVQFSCTQTGTYAETQGDA